MTFGRVCPGYATRLLAFLGSLGTMGCSYLGSARDFDPESFRREDGWLEVSGVRPVRQKGEGGCGLAALEMVLAYWGECTTADDIAQAGLGGDGRGARAGDLRDYARSLGLQAFLFRGEIADFEKELSKERPLVVGLVKPCVTGVVTHYEVVVAWNPERRSVVTLDPARGWRVNSLEGFLREWEPAGKLILLVFREAKASTLGGRSPSGHGLRQRRQSPSSDHRHGSEAIGHVPGDRPLERGALGGETHSRR